MRKLSILFTPIVFTLFSSGAIHANEQGGEKEKECKEILNEKKIEGSASYRAFSAGSKSRSFQYYTYNLKSYCTHENSLVSDKALGLLKQIDFTQDKWQDLKYDNKTLDEHIDELRNAYNNNFYEKNPEKEPVITKKSSVDIKPTPQKAVMTIDELKEKLGCKDSGEEGRLDCASSTMSQEERNEILKEYNRTRTNSSEELSFRGEGGSSLHTPASLKVTEAREREQKMAQAPTCKDNPSAEGCRSVVEDDIKQEEANQARSTATSNQAIPEDQSFSLGKKDTKNEDEDLIEEVDTSRGIAGNTYDLTDENSIAISDINNDEMYDIGNGISVPGSAIAGIKKEYETCLKQANNEAGQNVAGKQGVKDQCAKQSAQTCQLAGGFCKNFTETISGNDQNYSEHIQGFKYNSNEAYAKLDGAVDFAGIDCIKMFTKKADDPNLIPNPEGKDNVYLIEQLKLETQGEVLSSDVDSGMYVSSNTCNQVLGRKDAAFTDSSRKLKISTGIGKLKFCKDVFQAAINTEIAKNENGNCLKAYELMTQRKAGDSCVEGNPGEGVSGQTITTDQFTEKCKQNYQDDVAVLACVKNEIRVAQGNQQVLSGQKRVNPSCIEAQEAMKSCLSGDANKQEASYLRILSGCIGLKRVADDVRSQLDSGEDEVGYQSVDSQIRCVVKAPESPLYALDYLACRKAAKWYNGTFLGADLLGNAITPVYEAYKTVDIQGDQVKDMASGGVDAQTAAFNAQKRQYNMKGDSEATKGVLQGAKAMAMFGNLMFYPTPNIVSENWCAEGSEELFNVNRLSFCHISLMAESNNDIEGELFPNQNMKQVMLNIGVQSFSQAVIHAIVAGNYRKQANMVSKVEQALKDADFNQEENQIDLSNDFCLKNPHLASCKNGTGGRTSTGGVDFSFDGITPNTGGQFDFSNGDVDADHVSSNNVVKPTDEKYEELDNLMNTKSENKFDKDFDRPSAAKASGGGGGGGGSSGGAGGGGGGAATAPGGGRGGAGDGSGSNSVFGAKTGVAYKSGASGFATRSGGSVANKKSSSKNPFAAAFGKRKNQRGIASIENKQLLPKKSRLFEVISRRYEKVNQSGGLLKVNE